MATPSMAMTPPPSLNDASAPAPTTPTSPMAASPAPPKPSPQMQKGTQDLIQAVSLLRGIAQSYPGSAPHVARMNEEARAIMRVIMQNQEVGEPAAPPITG